MANVISSNDAPIVPLSKDHIITSTNLAKGFTGTQAAQCIEAYIRVFKPMVKPQGQAQCHVCFGSDSRSSNGGAARKAKD